MPVQQMQQPSTLQELMGAYNQANTVYTLGSALSSYIGGATASEAMVGASGGLAGAAGLAGAGSLIGGIGALGLMFGLMGDQPPPTVEEMYKMDKYDPLPGLALNNYLSTGEGFLGEGVAGVINLSDPKSIIDAFKPEIQMSLYKGEKIDPKKLVQMAQYNNNQAALAGLPTQWWSAATQDRQAFDSSAGFAGAVASSIETDMAGLTPRNRGAAYGFPTQLRDYIQQTQQSMANDPFAPIYQPPNVGGGSLPFSYANIPVAGNPGATGWLAQSNPMFPGAGGQSQSRLRNIFMGATPTQPQTLSGFQQPKINLTHSLGIPGSFFGTTGDPRFNF